MAPGGLEVLPIMLSPSNLLPQATNIATETCQYEDQEHQLMIDCVEQFCTWGCACGGQLLSGLGSGGSAGTAQHGLGLGGRAAVVTDPGSSPAEASQQVVYLSDELARKAEDTVRQQEEISQLLAQVVDLQQKCRTVGVPCPRWGVPGGCGAQLPDLPAPARSTPRRWRSSSSTWPWQRRCSSSSGRR